MRIIAGEYRGRVLKTTVGPGFRPAMGKVREALFSMLEARGTDWPRVRALDLFAGSGSLGFEALSRGAAFTCFVESEARAAGVIAANAEILDVPPGRCDIRQEKTAVFLARPPDLPFSLVFIDPPYALDALGVTLAALLKNGWVAPGGVINAEVEKRARFSPGKFPGELELAVDRAYGQTRILLWTVN
jgi:16S rRNA (guanine966-N2)-methyltransferase